MNTNEKAGTVATVHGSNQNEITDGNPSFDAFDSAIKIVAKQDCERCFPRVRRLSRRVRICADCAGRTEHLADSLLSIVQPHRIVRLDQRCTVCKNHFTSKKMSRIIGVCKECFESARSKNIAALNNLIARAASNYQRFLREGFIQKFQIFGK